MNADLFKGKWRELKGDIKMKWGKLTDDDLTRIEGKEEKLLGLIQQKYGYSKDQAEEEYEEFIARFEHPRASRSTKKEV
jgi:uncharacterized protein YjbJ (UPF0337 family)